MGTGTGERPLDVDRRSPPAVGIDLGTTNSVLAYVDPSGRPRSVANSEGDLLTPSVVFFENTDVIVGKEALKAFSAHAAEVARCMKRDLGRRYFPQEIQGRHFPPEALQACVLNKLRQDAARVLGELGPVVITVPAYFDEARRKVTQDAGFMAGLEVLDIINEPTAAAIAFGFEDDQPRDAATPDRPLRILVYDLGGGTFDVTIMEIVGSDYTTLATDGDVRLGGEDWDARLVDHVADAFRARHGVDPREDLNARARLWRDCEDAKRTLSSRAQATVHFDHRQRDLRLEITRVAFERMTGDLLERTLFTTRQTLRAAGLDWSQVDRVLLVGGSTRMPAVVAALRELTGKEPDVSVAADEAVAYGAALHAQRRMESSRGVPPRFSIRNVNAHSLGVVAIDPRTQQRRNAVIIPRNTPIPVSFKRIFKTQKAGQASILVQIVEGESLRAEECAAVGRCTVADLPRQLPAQSPVEVRFDYLDNGRLRVLVKVIGTDRWNQLEIHREQGLNVDQLRAWRDFVTGNTTAIGGEERS
jgi:molecular chaperone DnaK